MKLSQLEFLVSLNTYGTFSAAAKALNTFQPTVSAGIISLEKELGSRLLERSKDGVTFNEEGKAVLRNAGRITLAVANLKRLASQGGRPISIGANAPLCSQLVLPVVESNHGQLENFEVSIKAASTDDLMESLLRGEYDLAVAYIDNIPKEQYRWYNDIGVSFTPLFKDRLIFTCREGHPLLSLPEIKVTDLLKYPCVSYYPGIDEPIQKLFDEYNYSQPINHIVEIVSLRRFVATTDALAIQGYAAMRNGNRIYADKLVPLSVEGAYWENNVALIHMSGELTSLEKRLAEELASRSQALNADSIDE